MKKALLFLAFALSSCSAAPDGGVSFKLACERKSMISDVCYELNFDIPSSPDSSIKASETISFIASGRSDIVLDFRESTSSSSEHIVIPRRQVKRGPNRFSIDFTAGEQSLNRREEFLYTLLVPDRARTLFPCFDQPDIKAVYRLTLTVPEEWTAVSNTYTEEVCVDSGRKTVRFAPTEPLSTYLFSFVAGKFRSDSVMRNGRPIHLYHRETDPAKIAQCREILSMVCASLDYLEEYTDISYPFAKYDCIAIPDFQYGGMEHTGATLYNDRSLFLGPAPTTDELLDRASLIAHETAHMWFGDYVTMRWFNDVWTKEVFANWMAAKMIRPMFPSVNHKLGDMKNYYASSYSEDRTIGSNAIQRPLDNLDNAGLIYCNIIYDKAPVVMEMLAERLGYDNFRNGVREYLKEYAYGNADWDALIEILSGLAGFDMAEWSRVWIKEKGMPEFETRIDGGTLTVVESDPFGNGNLWQEKVPYTLIGDENSTEVTLDFTSPVQSATVPFVIRHVIPNSDGSGYGYFKIDDKEAEYFSEIFPTVSSAECRMSMLMTLYENALRGRTDAGWFPGWTTAMLCKESDRLISSSLLSYGAAIFWRSGRPGSFENGLYRIASSGTADPELRLKSFRMLGQTASTQEVCEELKAVLTENSSFHGLELSENDMISLAYQMMIRFPAEAESLRELQAGRISNPDRLESFEFISRACSGDAGQRDRFFEYLLTAEGRANESRARSALSLLNHPLREEESRKYILPALNIIEEVQKDGDIFFPQAWCSALLGGHCSSPEVRETVRSFLNDRKDLNPLLATKIRQQLLSE